MSFCLRTPLRAANVSSSTRSCGPKLVTPGVSAALVRQALLIDTTKACHAWSGARTNTAAPGSRKTSPAARKRTRTCATSPGRFALGRGRRAGRRPNHKFPHVLVIVKLVSSHLAKSSAHSLQLRKRCNKSNYGDDGNDPRQLTNLRNAAVSTSIHGRSIATIGPSFWVVFVRRTPMTKFVATAAATHSHGLERTYGIGVIYFASIFRHCG
jgi:hypothetical protein